MIPFGSGLRTDSTVIRYGRPWGRLKRAILARFGWRPRPVGATPMAPSLIKCCDRCFDKSPAGDHKTTLIFVLQPLSTVCEIGVLPISFLLFCNVKPEVF
ncbi:hypothetical protein [Desulforamulus hydrothermalis]|uniref:hypothetical protein n=1 Tax=Desulforamulus hydrothermalis TaxID=412895 RepID=UPI001390E082|nr:hypothetical protein [Desulforamulus hydrothermalis]